MLSKNSLKSDLTMPIKRTGVGTIACDRMLLFLPKRYSWNNCHVDSWSLVFLCQDQVTMQPVAPPELSRTRCPHKQHLWKDSFVKHSHTCCFQRIQKRPCSRSVRLRWNSIHLGFVLWSHTPSYEHPLEEETTEGDFMGYQVRYYVDPLTSERMQTSEI